MQAGQSRKFAGAAGTERVARIRFTGAHIGDEESGVKPSVRREATEQFIAPQARLFHLAGAE